MVMCLFLSTFTWMCLKGVCYFRIVKVWSIVEGILIHAMEGHTDEIEVASVYVL